MGIRCDRKNRERMYEPSSFVRVTNSLLLLSPNECRVFSDLPDMKTHPTTLGSQWKVKRLNYELKSIHCACKDVGETVILSQTRWCIRKVQDKETKWYTETLHRHTLPVIIQQKLFSVTFVWFVCLTWPYGNTFLLQRNGAIHPTCWNALCPIGIYYQTNLKWSLVWFSNTKCLLNKEW